MRKYIRKIAEKVLEKKNYYKVPVNSRELASA